MVAQGRGLQAHGIEDGDVAAARRGRAQFGRQRGIVGGVEEGARDVVVARREEERALGHLGAEVGHQGRQPLGVGDQIAAAVHVGHMQHLQGVGRFGWRWIVAAAAGGQADGQQGQGQKERQASGPAGRHRELLGSKPDTLARTCGSLMTVTDCTTWHQ
jgi:hypothetical protein